MSESVISNIYLYLAGGFSPIPDSDAALLFLSVRKNI